MFIAKIQIADFRNIQETELEFGRRFNILYGNNGQGKTNILEAIYLLGTMKSFRMARNNDLITWGSPHSFIRGWIRREEVGREIALFLDRQGKKARIDRKPVTRLADFFGNINAVVFSPEEIGMVRGGPDMRRRYLDRAIFSGDTAYLLLYHEYYKILKNRNALLKKGDRNGLDIWSEKLAEAGARLVKKRLDYLAAVEPLVNGFYGNISGADEKAGLAYRPGGFKCENCPGGLRDTLLRLLTENTAEELRRGTTLAGPHRDDVEFALNGRTMRHHGSQGQQRSFVLALKMAEIEYLERLHGAPPVLLLDDISSELDRQRNMNLMNFLQRKTMQVFITTTDIHNLHMEEMDTHAAFLVRDGKVTVQ